jgi:hypothetical protein
MLNQLDEINDMDKSEMDCSEKKEPLKEVRAIKSQIRSSGNDVLAGAIIIILFLIILL